jgi:hypothetical protein
MDKPKQIDDQTGSAKLEFGVDLESHSLRCQQFRSNVRLKNATPTLVGGAAFQSDGEEDQTYLIIEAIVND